MKSAVRLASPLWLRGTPTLQLCVLLCLRGIPCAVLWGYVEPVGAPPVCVWGSVLLARHGGVALFQLSSTYRVFGTVIAMGFVQVVVPSRLYQYIRPEFGFRISFHSSPHADCCTPVVVDVDVGRTVDEAG